MISTDTRINSYATAYTVPVVDQDLEALLCPLRELGCLLDARLEMKVD